MNSITEISLPAAIGPAAAVGAKKVSDLKADLLMTSSMLGAVLATAASLGIATFAGWQRGGLPAERAMNIVLSCVAVLFAHLLPAGWHALGRRTRFFAFALWCVSLVVVLYGQVTFFMVSQLHAGDQRAETVPGTVQHYMNMPPGRTLTQIAQDTANVTGDLARAKARPCLDNCPGLNVRRSALAAQLAALDTEASEAKRREAEEDRRVAEAERIEVLRAALRADPVASVVASWVHTTESRLELMLAVACAVVLEGSAVMGWTLVSVAMGRASSRESVVLGRAAVVPEPHVVAPQPGFATIDSAAGDGELAAVAVVQGITPTGSDARPFLSEDDLLLEKIHDAVLAGEVDSTQESIRKLLRCGQPKAGRLNRLYRDRFGRRAQQDGVTDT